MRAVVAIAMPMEPPMLRSMLKSPVALPISSRERVEVDRLARGTNTKLVGWGGIGADRGGGDGFEGGGGHGRVELQRLNHPEGCWV